MKQACLVQVNVPARELILSEQATIGEAMAATLTRGDVVEGVVTRVVDFGAFVSLKSPDGGMHGAMVSALLRAPCLNLNDITGCD